MTSPAAATGRSPFACCFGATPSREEFEALKAHVIKTAEDAKATASDVGERAKAGHELISGDLGALQSRHSALEADLGGVKAALAGLRPPAEPSRP